MTNLGWLGSRPEGWDVVVAWAKEEDWGPGDLTASIWRDARPVTAYIETQAVGVICGVGLAAELFEEASEVEVLVPDGSGVVAGTRIMNLAGSPGEILKRERIALNFMMHLSGVASLTAQYVHAIEGTGAQLVDTRKTIPGLRVLQKYAVRCGGGRNHRMGLFDAAMLKDNHIRAAGSIASAVSTLRATLPFTAKVEVECESEAMVAEAIDAGAEIVMLDNMSPDHMRAIVERYRGRALFEASGGVNLETIRAVAESGVDYISVGALTHSAKGLTMHLEMA